MNPGLLALITFGILMVLILSGVHLCTSLMITSVIGVYLITNNFSTAMNVLSQAAWGQIRQYMFGVIPLFVLMGMLANLSGASQELYDSASLLLKRVRGGIGIATIIANAIFAAITGVSIASAAVFTKIAFPQMTRLRYDRKVAVGTVSGSAVLGMLIPPSLLMIVYGSQADTSIGKLFIAGVGPGIVLTIAFIITILIIAKTHPDYIPEVAPLTEEEKKSFWRIVLKPWAILLLILISLGGIWLGFFTPTEAGGVGAFGAFLIVLLKGKFNVTTMWETLLSTASTTGGVLILLISANTYSKCLSMAGVINLISGFLENLNVPSVVVILIFLVILLALGCILDSTSILLLMIPLMVPTIRALNYDPVWFGIIMIIAVECGLITPPFGMNVYTVKAALMGIDGGENTTIEEIFSGSIPFLISMIIVLLLCVFVPDIVMLLPNLMLKPA